MKIISIFTYGKVFMAPNAKFGWFWYRNISHIGFWAWHHKITLKADELNWQCTFCVASLALVIEAPISYLRLVWQLWVNHYIYNDKHRLLGPVSISHRRLIARFRKFTKPRDLYSKLSDRSEIWQAPRQHCGSYDKTSYRILKQSPDLRQICQWMWMFFKSNQKIQICHS